MRKLRPSVGTTASYKSYVKNFNGTFYCCFSVNTKPLDDDNVSYKIMNKIWKIKDVTFSFETVVPSVPTEAAVSLLETSTVCSLETIFHNLIGCVVFHRCVRMATKSIIKM